MGIYARWRRLKGWIWISTIQPGSGSALIGHVALYRSGDAFCEKGETKSVIHMVSHGYVARLPPRRTWRLEIEFGAKSAAWCEPLQKTRRRPAPASTARPPISRKPDDRPASTGRGACSNLTRRSFPIAGRIGGRFYRTGESQRWLRDFEEPHRWRQTGGSSDILNLRHPPYRGGTRRAPKGKTLIEKFSE